MKQKNFVILWFNKMKNIDLTIYKKFRGSKLSMRGTVNNIVNIESDKKEIENIIKAIFIDEKEIKKAFEHFGWLLKKQKKEETKLNIEKNKKLKNSIILEFKNLGKI